MTTGLHNIAIGTITITIKKTSTVPQWAPVLLDQKHIYTQTQVTSVYKALHLRQLLQRLQQRPLVEKSQSVSTQVSTPLLQQQPTSHLPRHLNTLHLHRQITTTILSLRKNFVNTLCSITTLIR